MSDVLVPLSDDAKSEVQNLIRINIDSAEGFKLAASEVDSPDIAAVFREYAGQRSSNAEELKAAVAYNGDEPAQSGSVTAQVHRWWIELKSKVTSGGVHAVLSEAERGEDSILHTYQSAVKKVTGTPVASVLEKQLAAIQAAHDNVRDLRDAYKTAK